MLKSFTLVIVMAVISALVGLVIGKVTNTFDMTPIYAPVIFATVYYPAVVLPAQRRRRRNLEQINEVLSELLGSVEKK